MKKIIVLLFLCVITVNSFCQDWVKSLSFSGGATFVKIHGFENEKLNTCTVGLGFEINNFMFNFSDGSHTFYYNKENGTQTNTRIIYVGPDGGHYYINSNGNKVYVGRNENTSSQTIKKYNNYQLQYNITNIDLSYKINIGRFFIGPTIGYCILTPKLELGTIDESKVFVQNVLNEDPYSYYQNDIDNTSKSSLIFGGILGVKFPTSDNFNFDIYTKLTNKTIGLYIEINLSSKI